MRAILLSAAKPSFSSSPISELTIEDLALLDIQVSCLRSGGVSDITVVSGYQSEQVARADLNIIINPDWAKTGSSGSLNSAAERLDGSDDVLLIYGDTLFEPWVIHSLSDAKKSISALCLIDRSNHDLEQYREFAELEDGTIHRIGSPIEGHGVRSVFTGMCLIDKSKANVVREHLSQLVNSNKEAHIGELFNQMLAGGIEVHPVLIERGWAELSNETSYQQALSNHTLLETVIQLHTDWAQRAQGYDKLDWVNNDALLSGITKIAKETNPTRVLDVGTGSGKVLLAIRDTLGDGEFWGIDSSQAMLDKIPAADDLTLKISDAETLENIPDSWFNLVTARMVFHHIGNIPKAVQSIRRVLQQGGRFVICEGVPPTLRTIEWYTEMFRYKEDRNTLTEVDLINMLIRGGFEDIQTRTVVMRRASLNNWLDNSGIPQTNIDIIKKMHFDAPKHVQEDYDMVFEDNDCLMTWKFTFAIGRKPNASR